ncbi:glycerol kinase GlpK [soil metagenome]
MDRPLILALDQGTTSGRAIVFDQEAAIVATAQAEFPQIYPQEGWVEHDPEAIWKTQLATARKAVRSAEAKGGKVVAIGVTNQRETTIVWDRATGEPIHNAIVWQDRRTAPLTRRLADEGAEEMVCERTGLRLDPYFSASKIAWILDHVKGSRTRARKGELAFGTVDSFLIWRLTGGRVHATDATNACRTSLFDINKQAWDEELCRLFDVPMQMLPDVRDCAADYGVTDKKLFGRSIPILGVAGDQHAAAIGQCGFAKGDVKATFGTGAFMLVNSGAKPTPSKHRLLSTLAYRLDGKTTYALEGSIFVAGAAVQWLRDGLGLIKTAAQTEALARSIPSSGGVYMVPAFTGLGAPHWGPDARGAIYGLTRATGPAELARAALESVGLQTLDLVEAVAQDGVKPAALKVDGGMVANDWLCQALCDIVGLPVDRPKVLETTALGAAYLAGRQAGVYGGFDDFQRIWSLDRRFEPQMKAKVRDPLIAGWRDAVSRTLTRRA